MTRRVPAPMSPARLRAEVARIFPGASAAQCGAVTAMENAAWWLRRARDGDRVALSGDVIWDGPGDAA